MGRLAKAWAALTIKDGVFMPARSVSESLRSLASNEYECVAVAWACVNLLSRSIRQCPFMLVDKSGQPTDVRPPGYVALLNPAPAMDPSQFWGMVWRDLAATGNAYVYLERNRRGQIARLRYATGTVLRADAAPRYNLTFGDNGGGINNVGPQDVLAFHGEGYDGYESPSPVALAGKASLDQYSAIQQSATIGAKRGWWPWMVAKLPSKLQAAMTPEQETEFVRRLNESRAANDVFKVIPDGVSVDNYSPISGRDLQIIELLRWNLLDICRVFNVPPRMVFEYQTGTRIQGNFGGQSEDFAKFSVRPHLEVIGAQLTRKLLPRSNGELFIRLDADELQRGTMAERVNLAKEAVANSLMTPNEAREILGLPEIDGGDTLLPMRGAPEPRNTEEGE